MTIYLIKDLEEGEESEVERVLFQPEEFKKANEFMQSLPDFRSRKDEGNYFGPDEQYVGLSGDRKQVQLQRIHKNVLEGLLSVLQPKYYLDQMKLIEHPRINGEFPKECFLPIEELVGD